MIRVRFAVAPTGPLFVGRVRVALANDLFARRRRGQMLLRLDDLDQERCRPLLADQITQDLQWLGIEWDAVWRQSERRALYDVAIERLQRERLIYPCFETEEELKAKQAFRRKRNQPVIYDRAMLALTPKQRADAEAGGKRPHWRFKLSGRTLAWKDLILGPTEARLAAVSDPVVVREDGWPTPILASVVDDVDHGTTHVIRGDEGAGTTAVQIELLEVLGALQAPRGGRPAVRFGHLPTLADAGGRKAGGLVLRALRADGVEASALAGWMVGGRAATLPEIAAQFELASVGGVHLDIAQLLALNRGVLGGLEFAAVADRLPAGATEAFWLAVRGSLDLLKEARGWWDVVAGTIVPPVIEGERDLLLLAGEKLPPEPWDRNVWRCWVGALEAATGRTGEALLAPLRLALTGEDSGPDLGLLLPLIGRPRAASRLAVAAA